MKHKAAVILLTAVFSAGTIFPAMAGSWQKNEAGWWYRNDDGSWPAGIWQWVDGNSDGAAECYYFDSNGYMLESKVTPDGYMVNENGAWTVDGTVQTKQVQSGKTSGSDGWHYENGGWKYYENGSFLRNVWKYISGNWYYFSGNGNMATGLIYVSGDRYYLNSDGRLRMESFEENGIYYQIDGAGKIVGETDRRKEAQLSGRFDEESGQEVLKLTNKARTEAGVGTLEWDESLAGCARTRAVEIGKNFAHSRPDGKSWKTVIDEAGIVTMAWGENIAQGQFTSEEAMEDWLNSEGHRANLLKERYTKTGAACYVENGVHYWVQLFIQ